MGRTMLRRGILVTALAGSLALATAPVWAVTPDQFARADTAGYSAWVTGTNGVAQPFTPGTSGLLTSATVNVAPMTPTPSPLVVGIYDVANGMPVGTPLAEEVVPTSQVATMPVDRALNPVTVAFSTPAAVTAGSSYAIVLSVARGNPSFHWFFYSCGWDASYCTAGDNPSDFAVGLQGGNWPASGNDVNGVSWSTFGTYSYATYIAGGAPQGSGAGTASDGGARFPLVLRLDAADDGPVGVTEVSPGWIQLPDIPAQGRSSRSLLGWATTPNFPVDRARDQVAKGWGAIDEVIGGERMIFIPARQSTAVTGPTTLYAIWG